MARPASAAVRLLTGEREPCRLATTANITLSGLQTIDGVLTEVGDRILVKNQTDATANGIYTASPGLWQRASDARTSRTMQKGTTVSVQQGTVNTNSAFSFQTFRPDIGTDDITLLLYYSNDIYAQLIAAQAAAAASADTAAAEAVAAAASVVAAAAEADAAAASADAAVSIGAIGFFPCRAAPGGWLKANGALVSRTTYADLFGVIAPAVGTCTITIATPAVITRVAHGLSIGDKVSFETTGALPTALSVGTNYFIISAGFGVNSFRVSASFDGAAVNTSGTQSGIHTLRDNPSGGGDGSTTFALPDLRAEFVRGWDDGRGIDDSRQISSAQLDALLAHTHGIGSSDTYSSGVATGETTAMGIAQRSNFSRYSYTQTEGNVGTETRPRNIALLGCVRY